MKEPQILGYAAMAVGEELTPYRYDPPELGPHDVRITVTHCGVCHTDIQAVENYYGISHFPFVPGHEIVGRLEELGSGVTGLEEGDRVAVGWQARSCGQCDWCRKGLTQLCMDIENTTVMVPAGGFSTSVIADYRFVYQLPPEMRDETAAVLMCAGVSVYSALERHGKGAGQKTAVLGVGGLGHMAIQFAHALGCEVTAISSSPEKENQALAFGADRFVNSQDPASMKELEYTQDLLLCTANAGFQWNPVLMALKKRGKLVLIGFPDLAFNSTDLIAHELTITGSLIGNPETMRSMLDFSQQHSITPLVELMPLSEVNHAIERVKQNQARYRIVLVNDRLHVD